eukprot:TRINITY_DN185_c0_g1_i2.p1 TRINITY_DN185_c0_g1~~TRINITY_DN185_c0_g1_i2.p1  ORF type:complete len:336 (-),score=62.49 TRINITY_DN185_c0_g1_i2:368-1348(-)
MFRQISLVCLLAFSSHCKGQDVIPQVIPQCPLSVPGLTWEFKDGRDQAIMAIPTRDMCYLECLNTAGCAGATWQLNDIAEGICFLFKEIEEYQPCHFCESAKAPLPVNDVCNAPEDDVLDIQDVKNQLDCIDRCARKSGECQFYSYFGEESILPNKCMLFKSCEDVTNAEGCPDIHSGEIQCFMPPQCSDYKILDHFTRKDTFRQFHLCDTNDNIENIASPDWDEDGWYRVKGEAGSYIPAYEVPFQSCGTVHSGYLKDTHPVMHGETKNATVCFTDADEPCAFEKEIQITRCAGFFVYKLEEPGKCDARYCTSDHPTQQITSDNE